ncbi:uncharacterized protein LOC126971852 isoform X1 [Leptidea sinapis]|uniref:uncharacterized protein LOC126971852 isoform X1 n=1 Tax=Leptidea sinapis TaxID=189913 RepID=UPI0021371EA8|nr:uncharacterized protein LOC126971852 isoform X1 [Leptidea sinapis]
MWKLVVLSTLISVLTHAGANPILDKLQNNRQKRLLFYDEDGNLVKTYNTPFLYDFGNNIEERNPMFYNFVNPFYKFIRPTTLKSSITYMIPVSDAVIHEINTDPLYHNKIYLLSTRDPKVEVNPLCAGKRTQIPSPRECNSFLNCWDGWAFEQECPAGLLFSNAGYCDYAYNVDCQNKMIQEIPLPICNKDFEAFRNNDNCHEFFVCVRRSPVKFLCPADLIYNEEIGVCDYPYAVNCTRREIQRDEVSTTAVEVTSPAGIISNEAPLISTMPSATSSDVQTFSKSNLIGQTGLSTQVAMSRQDAIRKLQLEISQLQTGSNTDKP